MLLPTDILELILQFHDQFNVADRKRRIHSIIRNGYQNWLLDAGLFTRFYNITEHECKTEIFPFTRGKLFVTNLTLWERFLSYFQDCEFMGGIS